MISSIESLALVCGGPGEKTGVAVRKTKHGVLPVVVFGAPTTALLHAKTLPKSSSLLEHPYHDLVFFFSLN